MAALTVLIALSSVARGQFRGIVRHLLRFRPSRRSLLTAAEEARMLREVGADLRAGVHPTAAFLAATDSLAMLDVSFAARLALAGAGTTVVTHDLARHLPVNRDILGAAAGIAIETGADLAAVLYRLADRADSVAAERRERRVATAQARLSAAVVGGLPLVGVFVMMVTGAYRDLEGLSLRLVVVAALLLICGITTTAWMVRR